MYNVVFNKITKPKNNAYMCLVYYNHRNTGKNMTNTFKNNFRCKHNLV